MAAMTEARMNSLAGIIDATLGRAVELAGDTKGQIYARTFELHPAFEA
jgi:hypothetical protein